ncbi:nucleolar protein 9 [Pseudomyrmex gracilis]|uniref:nucleolar protein 9 n=1 Tax=Pseudomyrmex gracilis TaxID=219809 RepID=UPI000995D5D1|nr:nucleolar protein 9 [Pseudomyrmex gracilis]
MSEVRKTEGKKRKKKRSSAQMAKKFARRRTDTSGQNLDQDTYHYLLRIVDVIRKDFPTSDERTLFVKNVYKEMAGREVEYACSQIGSRVMDSLLKYASLEDIQRLMKALESSLRKLLNDKFASHVLQKMIEVCADRGNRILDKDKAAKNKMKSKEDAVVEPDEVKVYNNIVLKLSKYILNNVEEFVSDTYASHVVCTAIECLAGLIDPDSENSKKSAATCLANRRPVIREYTDLLVQTCNRLHKWPQFYELTQNKQCFLVHCILYSLKDVNSKLINAIISNIIKTCSEIKPSFQNEDLANTTSEEISIRLLETCLITADLKSYEKLYKTFFAGKLKMMSLAQTTNFSVQRLLDRCSTKENLEQIFEEISEHLPEIFKLGFTGILVSIGNACARLQTKQGAFVTAIIKLLECDKTEDATQLIRCMVTLKTSTQLKESNDPPLTLHGSLITQAILNFNKPIKLVNSILAMNNEQLLRLFDNAMGSHILDAFMDSKYIGEKSREKLHKVLRGVWEELAKSKYGSRCLDKMWLSANMNQKQTIMEELVAAGESLRSTQSSKIIFNKLDVSLFARNKKDWMDAQRKGDKTQALFADIIGKK